MYTDNDIKKIAERLRFLRESLLRTFVGLVDQSG